MNDRHFKTEKGAIRHASRLDRFRPFRVWVIEREVMGESRFTVTDCWSDSWTRNGSKVVWTNTGA